MRARVPVVAMLEARRPDELASLLRHRGLQPYHAPALREEPQPDPAAVDAFITRLANGQVDLVILLTGVGTTAILETARSLERLAALVEALDRVTVLARGPKPVAALRAYGLRPALVAAAPYTTTEVLAALGDVVLKGSGNDMVPDRPASQYTRRLEAQPGEVYNVGGGEAATVWDILRKLEALAGRRAAVKQEPARPGDQRYTFADTGKLRSHLGWEPRTGLDDGLARQWAWQKGEPA